MRLCSFVVYVYAPTDCGSPEAQNRFYWKLSRSLRIVLLTILVVVGGDFNVQIRYLAQTEHHIRGQFFVPVDRADNNDRLTQVFF